MIPKVFTDSQVAELREMAAYNKANGLCPTCSGDGTYRYKGVEHVCEGDHFGHFQERLFRLYLLNGVPDEFLRLDWGDYPHAGVKEGIDLYLGDLPRQIAMGMGVDFSGPAGTGKTWAASYLQRQVIKLGYSAWWIPFWKLRSPFNRLTDLEQNRDFERMFNRVLLVIDDIEPPFSDAQQRMYASKLEEVVRTRAHNGLPTITTTNMTEAQFKKAYPRVASVLSGKQYRVELDGEDGRPLAREKRTGVITMKEIVPLD